MKCAALRAVARLALHQLFASRKMPPNWLKMSQIAAVFRGIGDEINCGAKLCAAH
jgi:hypothetical protein